MVGRGEQGWAGLVRSWLDRVLGGEVETMGEKCKWKVV